MLITNVKIIPIEGADIHQGFISIVNGKIASFGTMQQLSFTDDCTIDLANCTVYPGFIDGHCHLGLFGDGLGFEGDDGNEDTDPLTPALRALDGINALDRGFAEARQSGITTVVTGPGSANPIAGYICALKTIGDVVDDMVIQPMVAIKFALGENPKTTYNSKSQTPTTRMATAAMIREQLNKSKKYLEAIENAKNDEDLEEPEYDSKCEALLPLLRHEVKAHFHAHRADDIATALRLQKEFGFELVLIHCTEGHLIPDTLLKHDATAVCGPIIGSRSKPELSNFTEKNPGILSNKGMDISICTDHPEVPIHYLNISAGIAVREGLPHRKALEAVTIVPARQAGISQRVGSIAVGKDADLVVFDCDPFALTAKPRMVIINGEIVFKG